LPFSVDDVAMGDPEPIDTSSFPTLYEQDTDNDPSSGWVSYAQSLLTNQNFDPQGVDGIFGPHTASAVREFQSWFGGTADAVVGNQTWAALHGVFGVPGGTNRSNPHHGGGGGGGGGHDLSKDRIYFSTDPFYSEADDRVHVELVTTHGDPLPAGTTLATLTVMGPDGTEVLMNNLEADHELVPVGYATLQSIPLRSGQLGVHNATMVLDSGAGATRTFSFTPTLDLDQ
jgi:hypothetical protein